MVQFGHLRSRRKDNKQLYCLSPKVTYFVALGSFFITTCGLYLYFISVFGGISYSTPATVNTSEAEEKSNRNSSQIGGWVSPHQVDCKSFFDEPDKVYKQTSTELLHDEYSQTIRGWGVQAYLGRWVLGVRPHKGRVNLNSS
jgi:hypothetical protein